LKKRKEKIQSTVEGRTTIIKVFEYPSETNVTTWRKSRGRATHDPRRKMRKKSRELPAPGLELACTGERKKFVGGARNINGATAAALNPTRSLSTRQTLQLHFGNIENRGHTLEIMVLDGCRQSVRSYGLGYSICATSGLFVGCSVSRSDQLLKASFPLKRGLSPLASAGAFSYWLTEAGILLT
jgi:hypothetical protein